jgi:uncharacterized protein (TIGR02453 family)
MKNLFSFLSDLKNNNNKEWFDANRGSYEQSKKTMETLVQQIIEKISQFDSSVSGTEARKAVFRINRDVRFSNNKEPYKTNMGGFIVPGGKNSGKAGYYLHIEPGACFLAGGVYCPEATVLKKVREEIIYNTSAFKQIIDNKSFIDVFGEIQGEKLKRPPKGFPENFSDMELLKYKSYTVVHQISDSKLQEDGFVDFATDVFKEMKPFNQFINSGIDHS